MNDSIIKVEGLGKKYIIKHEQGGSYTALRDVISKKAKGWMTPKNDLPPKEEFWALRDINFEIKKGEAIGIIGKNGAGKSTLLKVLSRITEPSAGRIEINDRVASLLEVGTGFHPELTGRENIFLNGTILGMSRAEIKKKFDEIVEFSGIEKFLDTPVKRYSSGMYVRLAFAIAAHLEPEILIVDEVLAVGDAEFQKKCLGKIQEVTKGEGRTVLFVSHNLAAVQQLCARSLCLRKGWLIEDASTEQVIENYLKVKAPKQPLDQASEKNIYISDFRVYPKNNGMLVPGTGCILEMEITSKSKFSRLHFGIGINDKMGNRIFTPFTKYDTHGFDIDPGITRISCEISSLPLKPDLYDVHLYVGAGFEPYDYIAGGIDLEVHPYPFFEYSMPDVSHGPVVVKQSWYKREQN